MTLYDLMENRVKVSGHAVEVPAGACMLTVEFSKLGNRRKLGAADYQVDAEKTMTSASKLLLDSPTLSEITSHDGATRSWLSLRSLPSRFRQGVYLVPFALVVEVDNYLRVRSEERDGLVDRLCSEYPAAVAVARERLRGLFREGDYESVVAVRGAFSLRWGFCEIKAPATIAELSAELWERERARIESEFQGALDDAKVALRVGFAGIVDHLRDRLSPDADGLPKRFKKSTVDGAVEWLSTFDARNLTGDADLAELVGRLKGLLSGVEVGELRGNDALRDSVLAGVESIKSALDPLVETAPARSISLDDDL